jgi:hypothetical protein
VDVEGLSPGERVDLGRIVAAAALGALREGADLTEVAGAAGGEVRNGVVRVWILPAFADARRLGPPRVDERLLGAAVRARSGSLFGIALAHVRLGV